MTDLTQWHSYVPEGARWRLVPEGVETSAGLERTPGEPVTMRRLWARFRDPVLHWATIACLPVELLLATIATESEGDPLAVRLEPRYVSDERTPERVSAGLMQTLISTARETVRFGPVDRQWLLQADASLCAGAACIRRQATETGLDPPLVFAAYNAGGLHLEHELANRWHLRCYPLGTGTHIDRAVAWLGDAVAVVREERAAPGRDWAWFLGTRLL